ncbi:MAG: heavy-metal-associated domain-containing protein [Candidatus Oleimicrobiaceae bacterium]
MTLELYVPDISCEHCRMCIEKAVGGLPDVSLVEVDVVAKKVRVEGDVPRAVVEQAIRELGYTV